MHCQSTGTRPKYQHVELMEFKNPSTVKNNTAHEMLQNFTGCSYDKNIIPRTYKKLQKLNTKETKLSINKWYNEMNTLSKKGNMPGQ